jgi:hypothetical protein
LAYAKLEDGKVGFINTKGEWAIQPTFDGVGDFVWICRRQIKWRLGNHRHQGKLGV